MEIKRVYNNSVVVVFDECDREMIVIGKGIAYQKKIGDTLDESKIEKIFTLKDKKVAQKLEELVSDISPVYLSIADEIVEISRSSLDTALSDNIYITLIDHIRLSLEREKKGIILANPLLTEIKQFYKQEYELSLHAAKIIEKYLNIRISDDEAGFITLHIVNASMNQRFEDTMRATHMIQDILGIVEDYFHVKLNEGTLSYDRFVRHLQFFARRVLAEGMEQDEDDFMYRIGRKEYPEAYLCVDMITKRIKKQYKKSVTNAERGYLIHHIKNIIS